MRAVIATAEPFAAYHLARLTGAFADEGVHGTHLLPYPDRTHGAAFPTTADLDAVSQADVLLITGGVLVAWTEAVARHAHAIGVPVVYVELASLLPVPLGRAAPRLHAAGVASSASAADLLAHLGDGAPQPRVVGSPLLDHLPCWKPRDRHVLVLPTVHAAGTSGDASLAQACMLARHAGWQVTVRPHPRSDPSSWAGHTLDTSPTFNHAAATAQVVLAHPGSAFAAVAAMGVPIVYLTDDPLVSRNVPDHVLALGSHLGDPVRVVDALAGAEPASEDALEQATGPVGGASARIVELLKSAA
jgi:hypothetical protein